MGWLYLNEIKTRKQMIDHLRRPERFTSGYQVIRSQAIGNHHWYLIYSGLTGKTLIGLDLMQSTNYGWGYKDLDESAGPWHYDCPLSYLDKASAPVGFAVEWRERVRKFHAHKAAVKALKPGALVQYGAYHYRLNLRLPGGRWSVNRIGDGRDFHMRPSQLSKSIIITQGEPA